jgi:hypothetical protein
MPLEIIPKARVNELVVQELGTELLIYDLKNHKAYCLNETSALIWQMCDGNRSVSGICRLIEKKLKSTIDKDFVWLAIDRLKTENLLENSHEVFVDFSGLSRREAIKKVGLASMVALPLISSLIAPTAAMAQSGGCTTCIETGAECGTISDNCGGTLDCGTCTVPQFCGGGGVTNKCGGNCTPTTCLILGADCGSYSDGCVGTIDCGTCPPLQVCSGTPGKCIAV